MTKLCHLTCHCLIKVSGIDSEKFLQGQLTQDVQEITENQGALSAYCNIKGRVVSLFEIIKHEGDFYLSLPEKTADLMLETIKKYAAFSKVTLTKETSWHTYALWGENNENSDLTIESLVKKNLDHDCQTISTENLMAIRLKTKSPAFTAFKLFSKNILTIDQANNMHQSDWYQFLIEFSYPVIYPENSEAFLPDELSLNQLGALSFSKGCYLGQEVIARMHYLGQSKKTLKQAVVIGVEADTIKILDKITDQNGKPVGEVVNCSSAIDCHQTKLLILINRAALEGSQSEFLIKEASFRVKLYD